MLANGASGIAITGEFAIYLRANEIIIGKQEANDIELRFDTSTNDGLITWSRTNDYFQFADDVVLDETLVVNGDYLQVPVKTDATRVAAGTAGRIIFNTDDGQLNIDDGTNWTLPDGTTT